VFCEPASAASVAGLRTQVAAGAVPRTSRCVCVLTGNGLKDPETAERLPVNEAVVRTVADLREILARA
jgi:threonine synthase